MPESPTPPERRPARLRWAWWLLAYASLGLGIIALFIPGIPTTEFVLLSAWAASLASRSSHRVEAKSAGHLSYGIVSGEKPSCREATWTLSMLPGEGSCCSPGTPPEPLVLPVAVEVAAEAAVVVVVAAVVLLVVGR